MGTVTVVKRLYSGCYSVCARRAITATPPLSLSLVHLSVVVVARITCANVTPAGPDHVTTCSSDTHHCHALFSSLEGTLLVLTPNQKLRWLPRRINLNVSVLNLTEPAPRGGFVPLLRFPGCFPAAGIMTVKLLAVDYEKVNERGVFSPGDVLSGKVTLVTSKEIKAQCFSVKAKGRAKVTWCEREGRSGVVRRDKKRYFHLEHIILQDKNKGDGRYRRLSDKSVGVEKQMLTLFLFFPPKRGSEIISAGRNVYPFAFVMPNMCVRDLLLSISQQLVNSSPFCVWVVAPQGPALVL